MCLTSHPTLQHIAVHVIRGQAETLRVNKNRIQLPLQTAAVKPEAVQESVAKSLSRAFTYLVSFLRDFIQTISLVLLLT